MVLHVANKFLEAILGPKLDLTAEARPPIANASGEIVTPFDSDRSHFYAATFANLFDLDYIPVTRVTAMNIGVISKSRHMLTTPIASMPMIAMTGSDISKETPLICQQPEVGRSRSTSFTWWVDAMFFYGRVWLKVVGRDADRPNRFEWIPEWFAKVDATGALVEAFGVPVAAGNVVRIDGPHEGILNFAAGSIRERLAINLASANASANPVPSINLHQKGGTPMTQDQVNEMLAQWTAARAKRGGGVGYTNETVEAIAMGLQPEQLLIDEKKSSDLNLVRECGMPAWAVDATVEGSNLTYSNSPSRARELVDFSLQGYMTAISDRFSMDDILPPGQWCRIDPSALTRGDFLTRMQGYQAAITAGVYTAEQCQQIEAGVPLEGI